MEDFSHIPSIRISERGNVIISQLGVDGKKYCRGCQTEKAITEFSTSGKGGNARQTLCRVCLREYRRVLRSQRPGYKAKPHSRPPAPPRGNLLKLDRFEYARRFIETFKRLFPCKDCGKRFPHVAMDFDHLRDKLFSVSRLKNIGAPPEIIKAEIRKCELVCACCHRIRTSTKGHYRRKRKKC